MPFAVFMAWNRDPRCNPLFGAIIAILQSGEKLEWHATIGSEI
jgi:hypothetical protein